MLVVQLQRRGARASTLSLPGETSQGRHEKCESCTTCTYSPCLSGTARSAHSTFQTQQDQLSWHGSSDTLIGSLACFSTRQTGLLVRPLAPGGVRSRGPVRHTASADTITQKFTFEVDIFTHTRTLARTSTHRYGDTAPRSDMARGVRTHYSTIAVYRITPSGPRCYALKQDGSHYLPSGLTPRPLLTHSAVRQQRSPTGAERRRPACHRQRCRQTGASHPPQRAPRGTGGSGSPRSQPGRSGRGRRRQ